MKIIILSLLCAMISLCATVEEALFDWFNIPVDTYTQNTPAYRQGYEIGYKIGNNATTDQAITYLKSWVYLRGTQEKQKECTLDKTLNAIVESTQKSIIQSAISQQLKGQVENVVEEQALGIGQTVKSYISPRSFFNYIRNWWSGGKNQESENSP